MTGSSAIFLDTNGWLAVLSTDDSLHPEAETGWRQIAKLRRKIIVTDRVIAETGNSLSRTRHRISFRPALNELLASPAVRLIFVDRSLMERALTLYSNRPDKHWGLVDCASFVVMQDEGIEDAFTTDSHFEQAGFHRLLPGADF